MLSLDYVSLRLIASFFSALTTLLVTFAFIPAGFELQSSRAAIILSFGLIGPLTLAYRRILYQRSIGPRGDRNLVFVGEKSDFDEFSAECARMENQLPLLHADSSEKYKSFESRPSRSISQPKDSGRGHCDKGDQQGIFPADIPSKLVQMYFDGIPTYTLRDFPPGLAVGGRFLRSTGSTQIWLFQEGIFQIAREPVFERDQARVRHSPVGDRTCCFPHP